MEKKQLIILIASAVVALIIGILLGILYVKLISVDGSRAKVVNSLSSKLITSVTSYGQISAIDGRSITINYSGESLVVPIVEKAKVLSLEMGKTGPTQKEVEFSAIKVGDNVNIFLKVLDDGKMQGTSVVIFPASK